jgi:hypothetical protein
VRLLCVDPGIVSSGVVVLRDWTVQYSACLAPADLMPLLRVMARTYSFPPLGGHFTPDAILVEGVASYGMPVGADVFNTCELIGRIFEALHRQSWICQKMYRKDVKLSLCGSHRAKDANVRQALIDIYRRLHRLPDDRSVTRSKLCPKRHRKLNHGASCTVCRGTNFAHRGPLSGVKKHAWQALALGVAYRLDNGHSPGVERPTSL